MTAEFVLEIVRQSLLTAGVLAGPVLLSALVVGVIVSLFMAVTQINEATLTFIPKILAVSGVLLMLLPWMTGKAQHFMTYIFTNLPNFIR